MDFLEQFDAIFGLPVGTFAVIVMALCGICAVIARFLAAPAAGDSPLYRFFYALINQLAQNVGRATNADDAAALTNTVSAVSTGGTSAATGTSGASGTSAATGTSVAGGVSAAGTAAGAGVSGTGVSGAAASGAGRLEE